jgi:hypothetical protein
MAVLAYQFVRALKWLLWAGTVGYAMYFTYDRAPHINQFGNLTLSTEAMMFGLPLAAMVVGLFQLALRDAAYGPRPMDGQPRS